MTTILTTKKHLIIEMNEDEARSLEQAIDQKESPFIEEDDKKTLEEFVKALIAASSCESDT
jgi:hypothetical protein